MHGLENTTKVLLDFSTNVKSTIFTCGDSKSPSYIIQNEPIKKLFLDCVKKGIKYNYITEITKENILYCKEILKIIGPDELRHLDKIKGNFAVTESEYLATSTLLEDQPLTQLIHSNVKEIVEQQKYLFETLWDKSIPAKKKIREIEEGMQPDIVDIIQNPIRAKELYQSLVKNARNEIMIIFPTINAYIRQDRIGIIKF